MYQHLSDCFSTSVAVSEKLTRFKHWFQYEDENRVGAFEDLYVIALFRNPYDWIEMMRQVPYHSPRHKDMEWNDFVTTSWTMPRFGRDLLIDDANATEKKRNSDSRFCENNFYYNQVVPCVEDSLVGDMHPLYEHDPITGIPYPSILHLRRDKIVNFLSVEHYKGVKYFDAWKFEDIVQHGSSQLLKELEGVLGVAATCRPSNPTEQRMNRHKLSQEYVEWMKDHVDWNYSEALIGYHVSEYK
ncbi:hypothetical protein MHU86_1456 [Fragilaria crotonensis]|nr:hypothetical protein MHU86_1456 [Fragilaria crotonensis]